MALFTGLPRLSAPRLVRTFIVPTKTVKTVPVYRQTPRLIEPGTTALSVWEKRQYDQYDPDGSKRALLDKSQPTYPRAGDILRVVKRDGSTFVGMLLAINRNALATSILLRTKISSIGVENRFQVFNPAIARIELLRVPAWRWPKQKYYFVRGHKKYDAGDIDSYMRRQRRKQSNS